MKGPFGLVVAAGLAILVVAIVFSLAPTVGGSIEDSNPMTDVVVGPLTLYNETNVSTGHRNIGNVRIANNSDFAAAHTLRKGAEYVYDTDVGTVTLPSNYQSHNNINGSGYYVKMDISRWHGSVNTDVQEGGTWFGDNQTWVTLIFLGIVAAIIIGMFMRW